MKIKNDSLPRAGIVGVNKQTVQFIQQNDTYGDQDLFQLMSFETMAIDYSEKDNCDWFFRVRIGGEPDEEDTVNFWSVDSPKEIVELFNEVARRTGMSTRWKCEEYHVQPAAEIPCEQSIDEK
jgi:hypothetical protein